MQKVEACALVVGNGTTPPSRPPLSLPVLLLMSLPPAPYVVNFAPCLLLGGVSQKVKAKARPTRGCSKTDGNDKGEDIAYIADEIRTYSMAPLRTELQGLVYE